MRPLHKYYINISAIIFHYSDGQNMYLMLYNKTNMRQIVCEGVSEFNTSKHKNIASVPVSINASKVSVFPEKSIFILPRENKAWWWYWMKERSSPDELVVHLRRAVGNRVKRCLQGGPHDLNTDKYHLRYYSVQTKTY